MGQPFEAAIEQERARLTKEREALTAQQEALQQQIATIDRDLNAIAAYEAARKGTVPKGKSNRPSTSSGQRGKILELVKEHPAGLTRGEILDALGAKGHKAKEQTISTALTALKKQQKLQHADDGRYLMPA
jgi:Fe2+ or Zn2+ uptake regulation protein